MWDVKAKVIPVVMGALGSVPMVIDVEIFVKLFQLEMCNVGASKNFLRKVLEMLRRANQILDSVPWLP